MKNSRYIPKNLSLYKNIFYENSHFPFLEIKEIVK